MDCDEMLSPLDTGPSMGNGNQGGHQLPVPNPSGQLRESVLNPGIRKAPREAGLAAAWVLAFLIKPPGAKIPEALFLVLREYRFHLSAGSNMRIEALLPQLVDAFVCVIKRSLVE